MFLITSNLNIEFSLELRQIKIILIIDGCLNNLTIQNICSSCPWLFMLDWINMKFSRYINVLYKCLVNLLSSTKIYSYLQIFILWFSKVYARDFHTRVSDFLFIKNCLIQSNYSDANFLFSFISFLYKDICNININSTKTII